MAQHRQPLDAAHGEPQLALHGLRTTAQSGLDHLLHVAPAFIERPAASGTTVATMVLKSCGPAAGPAELL